MNPLSYSYRQSNRRSVVATNLSTVAEPTTFNALDSLQRGQTKAKFEFIADKSVTKYIHDNAVAMDMTISAFSDGTPNNRVHIKWSNGKGKFGRVFGVQKEDGSMEVLPPKTFTSEEIKKLEFGYCKSGDDIITEKNGDSEVLTVIYVKL